MLPIILGVGALGCGVVIVWLLWSERKATPDFISASALRELDTRVKSLEIEWVNTYDKLNRVASRLTKERGLEENPRVSGTAAAVPDAAAANGGLRRRMDLLKPHAR